MTERVEEIRALTEERNKLRAVLTQNDERRGVSLALALDEIRELRTALAQAERERDEFKEVFRQQSALTGEMADKWDVARAEVERLKGEAEEPTRALVSTRLLAAEKLKGFRERAEQAEAALARVRDERDDWKLTASEIAKAADERVEQLARVRAAIDQARRETASDPENRWCRNATIILDAAWAALAGR